MIMYIYFSAVNSATTTFTSTTYLTPSPTTGPTSTGPTSTVPTAIPTASSTSECTCSGTSSAPGIYSPGMTLWIAILTNYI